MYLWLIKESMAYIRKVESFTMISLWKPNSYYSDNIFTFSLLNNLIYEVLKFQVHCWHKELGIHENYNEMRTVKTEEKKLKPTMEK